MSKRLDTLTPICRSKPSTNNGSLDTISTVVDPDIMIDLDTAAT